MESTIDDEGRGQIPPRIVEVQGFLQELHRSIEKVESIRRCTRVHRFEAGSTEDFLCYSCTS